MAQNVHKMVKNAPNELKFGPDMYFHEFHQRRKIVTFLSMEIVTNRAFKNAQNWLKISILLLHNALKRNTTRIFDTLLFVNL